MNDNYQEHRQRRERLLAIMARAGGGVAVIPNAQEVARSRDSHYPFRADSYFHYLCGFPEPESVLLLVAGEKPQSLLFCRDKDPDKEVWDGFRYGPQAAQSHFGLDAAFSIIQFDEKLPDLLAPHQALWYSLGHDAEFDLRISRALNALRAQARSGKRAPGTVHDVRAALDGMRQVKGAEEIALMRRAASISAAAHRRAMRATRPGSFEYQVEAELLCEFRASGAQAPAYNSIVAGGANACILHYADNNRQLRDGELLLIDAACELDGYAADITRTFPVNGRFSGPQADIYDLVLDAQAAAVARIRPGAGFQEPHDAALAVIVRGLIDMKLLGGSVDGVIESEAYKRFYMHRTSHWLGLDVHDAGEVKHGEQWKTLTQGMVLTVEPGCYIRAADDVPVAFHDIGVRIEDDALVTAAGCELMSHEAPKTIVDIEALMRDGR